MHFKLEYTIRSLLLQEANPLTFHYPGVRAVTVFLRPPPKEERDKGHKYHNAFCTATCEVEPNNRVRDYFSELDQRIASRSKDTVSERPAYERPIATEPRLSECPDYFQSFLEMVRTELSEAARQTVSVLRWRTNDLGPHNPISMRSFDWSRDATSWQPLPMDITATFVGSSGTYVPDATRVEVSSIVSKGHEAPLHHDLFREAWGQRHANPRSALVIGMAAAEIGVKHTVAVLVPNAAWLAQNLPTPPLVRIITDYVPTLPAICRIDGKVKPLPRKSLDLLNKGVTMRNQLSHAGLSDPSTESVEAVLVAVQDLLWLLDFYTGWEWAFDHIHSDTRDALLQQQ